MKTIFLDRDGVISVFTPNDWIKRWEEFEFLPGAVEGLRIFHENNYRIIVISNQAGIGKGVFSVEDLENITGKTEEHLAKEGIKIDRFYYCIHTQEENCECRKPKPGLFYRARKEFADIDFKDSFFIGDSDIDVKAGKSAGTKTILVLSGKTKKNEETENWDIKPDFVVKGLEEAAKIVLEYEKKKKCKSS
ncbi:MAG TPA: HAD family hydrolase [bacterium]|nr:HAD family hydrolase [bacterium]